MMKYRDRYRDYKGNVCMFVAIAKDHATLEKKVIYKDQDGEAWDMPYNRFFGLVELSSGKRVPRFEKITDHKYEVYNTFSDEVIYRSDKRGDCNDFIDHRSDKMRLVVRRVDSKFSPLLKAHEEMDKEKEIREAIRKYPPQDTEGERFWVAIKVGMHTGGSKEVNEMIIKTLSEAGWNGRTEINNVDILYLVKEMPQEIEEYEIKWERV